jgi:hypothetical protein
VELSQQSIREFKAIYKADFNQELSDEEVEQMGGDLLRLLQLIISQ